MHDRVEADAKRGMLLRLHAAATPYYGDLGLNAGILMLSLERVRASNFTAERDELIALYQPQQLLPLGDQDVLNAYGSRHPEEIFKMPCIYNFRFDAGCYDGFPVILHGNRGIHISLHTTYNHLYTLFKSVHVVS
jgi:UDP-xylose:glucoside alpha-1,3-xylosyltransferase